MANSADVNAGDDILASQYNNLRKDVLNTSTGHTHDGADSKALAANSVAATQLTTDAVETAKIKDANVTNGKVKTGTGSATGTAYTNVTMQDYCFFPNVHSDSGAHELWAFTPAADDYIARVGIAIVVAGTWDIYWRYISSSGPPEIWIVRDESKGLYTIWECDDPAPDGKPPIECFDKETGEKIGETILIIPPENYAELKAQCQKDMAEKKLGAKPIGKVLFEKWKIDEDSNPERPVGLDLAILVKKLKKIGS